MAVAIKAKIVVPDTGVEVSLVPLESIPLNANLPYEVTDMGMVSHDAELKRATFRIRGGRQRGQPVDNTGTTAQQPAKGWSKNKGKGKAGGRGKGKTSTTSNNGAQNVFSRPATLASRAMQDTLA